jgi:hypothetical protein
MNQKLIFKLFLAAACHGMIAFNYSFRDGQSEKAQIASVDCIEF